MTYMKYLVAALLGVSLSFHALANEGEETLSPEEQCVDSDSYEDFSGFWHDCPGLDIPTQESEEDEEWPEQEEQPGEYEEDENNVEIEED